MDKQQILKALEQLKDKKRKFNQSYDLIITLKDIDIKTKPIDSFVVMPHSRGKKIKICALVGQELAEQAAQICDKVIRETEFDAFKGDKRLGKKLAQDFDFFIAQANLMQQVAAAFGRSLGPRGKMPNPKAGCVVPPSANLSALRDRLQKTVQIKAKNAPAVQCIVGTEEMSEEEVADNILIVYNSLLKLLPNEEQNVKSALLKKTMSDIIKV